MKQELIIFCRKLFFLLLKFSVEYDFGKLCLETLCSMFVYAVSFNYLCIFFFKF